MARLAATRVSSFRLNFDGLSAGASGFSVLKALASMKSGGGVLLIATLQLVIGTSLLGVYEGYKTSYFNSRPIGEDLPDPTTQQLVAERAFLFRTPLDFLFWYSCITSVCAVVGLAGIFAQMTYLVTIFFGYNLVQAVVSFNLFVDVLADQKIRYVGDSGAHVTGHEKAAAGLLFVNFFLSLASGYFTVKAAAEIKQKQREVYHEMSVVPDTLLFEPDV